MYQLFNRHSPAGLNDGYLYRNQRSSSIPARIEDGQLLRLSISFVLGEESPVYDLRTYIRPDVTKSQTFFPLIVSRDSFNSYNTDYNTKDYYWCSMNIKKIQFGKFVFKQIDLNADPITKSEQEVKELQTYDPMREHTDRNRRHLKYGTHDQDSYQVDRVIGKSKTFRKDQYQIVRKSLNFLKKLYDLEEKLTRLRKKRKIEEKDSTCPLRLRRRKLSFKETDISKKGPKSRPFKKSSFIRDDDDDDEDDEVDGDKKGKSKKKEIPAVLGLLEKWSKPKLKEVGLQTEPKTIAGRKAPDETKQESPKEPGTEETKKNDELSVSPDSSASKPGELSAPASSPGEPSAPTSSPGEPSAPTSSPDELSVPASKLVEPGAIIKAEVKSVETQTDLQDTKPMSYALAAQEGQQNATATTPQSYAGAAKQTMSYALAAQEGQQQATATAPVSYAGAAKQTHLGTVGGDENTMGGKRITERTTTITRENIQQQGTQPEGGQIPSKPPELDRGLVENKRVIQRTTTITRSHTLDGGIQEQKTIREKPQRRGSFDGGIGSRRVMQRTTTITGERNIESMKHGFSRTTSKDKIPIRQGSIDKTRPVRYGSLDGGRQIMTRTTTITRGQTVEGRGHESSRITTSDKTLPVRRQSKGTERDEYGSMIKRTTTITRGLTEEGKERGASETPVKHHQNGSPRTNTHEQYGGMLQRTTKITRGLTEESKEQGASETSEKHHAKGSAKTNTHEQYGGMLQRTTKITRGLTEESKQQGVSETSEKHHAKGSAKTNTHEQYGGMLQRTTKITRGLTEESKQQGVSETSEKHHAKGSPRTNTHEQYGGMLQRTTKITRGLTEESKEQGASETSEKHHAKGSAKTNTHEQYGGMLQRTTKITRGLTEESKQQGVSETSEKHHAKGSPRTNTHEQYGGMLQRSTKITRGLTEESKQQGVSETLQKQHSKGSPRTNTHEQYGGMLKRTTKITKGQTVEDKERGVSKTQAKRRQRGADYDEYGGTLKRTTTITKGQKVSGKEGRTGSSKVREDKYSKTGKELDAAAKRDRFKSTTTTTTTTTTTSKKKKKQKRSGTVSGSEGLGRQLIQTEEDNGKLSVDTDILHSTQKGLKSFGKSVAGALTSEATDKLQSKRETFKRSKTGGNEFEFGISGNAGGISVTAEAGGRGATYTTNVSTSGKSRRMSTGEASKATSYSTTVAEGRDNFKSKRSYTTRTVTSGSTETGTRRRSIGDPLVRRQFDRTTTMATTVTTQPIRRRTTL